MRAWICMFFLFAACSLSAQQFTGRVVDKTGAVIPNVSVTAHNVDTGVEAKSTTNGSGVYTIPYLKAGNYSVIVERQGFQTLVHDGINLQVGQTSVVDFELIVGKVSETVTVTGDTLLDAGKSDIGEVVENARVTELPLNGRDPMMLSLLSAGVKNSTTGYTRPFDDTQTNTSVNGGGAGNVEILLDGTPNESSPINITGGSTEGITHTAYTTPVDSVQEFKMVTSPYDAGYGLMSGGVEDVILKSGTNRVHGDIYEFARRTFLDANTWQNNWYLSQLKPGADRSSYRTPQSKWDQYGFELDGPIYVPKLYNGKNKSFFTLQFEHFKALSPLTDTASVPDPAWADGDFSNLDRWNGSSYTPKTIYDPLTSVKDTNSSSPTYNDWVRQPFAGNQIPAGRIDTMTQKLLKMYPKPNVAITSGRGHWSSNYVLSTTGVDVYDNVLAKWDENLSSKDRFSLRYGYWMWNNTYNGNGMPGPLATGEMPAVKRSHTFALEETHTFNSHLLFDFRANVNVREDIGRTGAYYDMTQLWSQSQVNSMGAAARGGEFPQLCWGDYSYSCYASDYTVVGSIGNNSAIKNSMNLLPTVTWIKGAHTIRAGLDARFWQNGYALQNGGPTIITGSGWTWETANHALNISTDGNDIASFLLGVPTSASNQIYTPTYAAEHYWAPFFQDDWKVTRKLTLNLGLRWDWLPSEIKRHKVGNYAFDTQSVNPYLSSVNLSQYGHGSLTGGVTFLAINGNPTTPYRTINTNYQPRFGFAYSLNNKTVIRGGFGKSMRAPQNGSASTGWSATTTGVTSNPGYLAGVFPNLDNKFESLFWGGPTGSVLQATGSSLGMATALGQGPRTLNPHYRIPSFWSYSLGFERQLPGQGSVNVSYVGSRLYDGDNDMNINLPNNSLRSACNPMNGGNPQNCDGTKNSVPNPFKGMSVFAGTSYLSASTMNTLDLSRPYPEFTDMTQNQNNDARTWYNSLQVTGLEKINKTMTIHATWTWTKLMTAGTWQDQNYGLRNRAVDSNDITHRITLSGVYTLPIGRGHMILPTANRIVDEFVGGWELSGMYILQTGTPVSMPGYQLANAKVSRHKEKSGYIRMFAPGASHYVQNGSTWAVQPYASSTFHYTYDGPSTGQIYSMDVPSYAPAAPGVNFTGIRTAGLKKFDTSFSKNFPIYEAMKLQLRLDAFNVLNHPEWTGGPDISTNFDANLGTITKGTTGSSLDPRRMQLSAKIVW